MGPGMYFIGNEKRSGDSHDHTWPLWPSFFKLFQNRENAEVARGLRELMNAAVACSIKLDRKLDLKEEDMIELEHKGDAAVDRIEEALEYAFIVRYGKGDPTRLVHELDDTIDRMRDVARHIETYARFLHPFPKRSWELIMLVQEGVKQLDAMVSEITNGRIRRDRVHQCANEIGRIERAADKERADAEKELAAMKDIPDVRAFEAHKRLNNLLESITDHLKHCAVGVLAIARQEA